jgi:hypothetical protein
MQITTLKPKLDEHVELIIGLVADKGLPKGLGYMTKTIGYVIYMVIGTTLTWTGSQK